MTGGHRSHSMMDPRLISIPRPGSISWRALCVDSRSRSENALHADPHGNETRSNGGSPGGARERPSARSSSAASARLRVRTPHRILCRYLPAYLRGTCRCASDLARVFDGLLFAIELSVRLERRLRRTRAQAASPAKPAQGNTRSLGSPNSRCRRRVLPGVAGMSTRNGVESIAISSSVGLVSNALSKEAEGGGGVRD